MMFSQVELIREVFKYAQRFVSKQFVIQISSSFFEHPRFHSLISDLALLHHNGIQLLLVPGAQQRIDTVLRQFNKEVKFEAGQRVSAEENLPLIAMAAFDMANRLMTEFTSQHINSVIGNWIRAKGMGVVNGSDFQMTGIVEKINTAQIIMLLKDGIIPILPCVGWNSVGQAYNVSSRELACALSVSLKAEKLFYITDSFFLDARKFTLNVDKNDGINVIDNQINSFSVPYASAFLKQNNERLSSDDSDTIEQAINAANGGVERVHIIDGTAEGAILREIFSTSGTGTMIYVNSFKEIRTMKPDDISDILRIMEPEVQRGSLIARSHEELLRNYSDFVVYEIDGSIRGCASLHLYTDGSAELAAIATDRTYSQLGIGNRLVGYLIEKASRHNVQKIFVLTTLTADWFLGLGFTQSTFSELPKERPYNKARNSRVYCLHL